MRVSRELLLEPAFVGLVGPDLRPGQEAALILRQAVDALVLLRVLSQVLLQCSMTQRHAADIGKIFPDGEFPVDVQARQYLDGIGLADELVRLRRQSAGLSASVHQLRTIALFVVQTTLRIEAMGDFVANHCAQRAVVARRVCLRVEERRLQEGGGDLDTVATGL